MGDPFTFDETGFERREEQGGIQLWYTPDGDGLGLFHFPSRPEIDAAIHDAGQLRAFYRQAMLMGGAGIIEVEPRTIGGCPAVRMIIKMPQQPSGITYAGTLTFPFRDFSFVWKVQCAESAPTGMRDNAVGMELLASGEIAIDEATHRFTNWLDDPYDPSEAGPMTRNLSERPEYDAKFPDHPLSRVRRTLDHLERTLTVDQAVKSAPPFVWQQPKQSALSSVMSWLKRRG